MSNRRVVNRWPALRIRDLRARLGVSMPRFAAMIDDATGVGTNGRPPLQPNRIHKWERMGVTPSEHYQLALDRLDRLAPPVIPVAGIDPHVIAG